MRVAYLLPSLLNPSGWRSLALSAVTALKEYSEAVVQPVLWVPAEAAQECREVFAGLPVYVLPVTQRYSMAGPRGWLGLTRSYLVIQSGKWPPVDLVHSLEAYPTGLVGHWLAQKMGCPHVLTANGTYGVQWYANRLDRFMYRRVLRRADLICPISQGTLGQMQTYFAPELARTASGDQTAVRTILLGNSFVHTTPVELAERRRLTAIPTLLSVGEVKPRKGHLLSLAAFARVRQRLPQARYWIAGRYHPDSVYFQRLQSLIREQRIEGVEFLGAVPEQELRRLYQEASVFVLTPQQEGFHFEGFGLVYLEAGAFGLPVVGTKTGGVPDAIQDGKTGILCNPGDVDGVAEALLRLLTGEALNRQMGLANRRWAETLTWERFAQEQFQAYQAVLTRAASHGQRYPVGQENLVDR